MAKPTFEEYLRQNAGRGVIDFALRKHVDHDGKITFYIHPAYVSGDTVDYIVEGNLLTPLHYSAAPPAPPMQVIEACDMCGQATKFTVSVSVGTCGPPCPKCGIARVSFPAPPARPPYETFKGAICRGSYALGSACGVCERCEWERGQR